MTNCEEALRYYQEKKAEQKKAEHLTRIKRYHQLKQAIEEAKPSEEMCYYNHKEALEDLLTISENGIYRNTLSAIQQILIEQGEGKKNCVDAISEIRNCVLCVPATMMSVED